MSPVDAINQAIDLLANSDNWARLRRTVRLLSSHYALPLPQQYKTLVRAGIGRRTITVHGPEFEFLHGGPGDYTLAPEGYAELSGFVESGFFPTEFDIDTAGKLLAFSTQETAPALRVIGLDADGNSVTVDVPVNTWTGPADFATAIETADTTDVAIQNITRVFVDSDSTKYITLYVESADSDPIYVSKFHPKVQVPEFRRYRLPSGTSCQTDYYGVQLNHREDALHVHTDGYYQVYAEVTLNTLPLVDDTDVLPFDTLQPLEEMLQAMWCFRSNEAKAGADFQALAQAHLKQREAQEQRRQEFVVENLLYDGGAADLSYKYWNI
jgi:hypothetical protein